MNNFIYFLNMNMNNYDNQNQIIQIYTLGVLKDEINDLRKLYIELRQETNQIINSLYIIDSKICNLNEMIDNDFEKKMIKLNI